MLGIERLLRWLLREALQVQRSNVRFSASAIELRGFVLLPRFVNALLKAAGVGGEVVLEVKGLCAEVEATGKKILKGVDLTVREGEVHAIMGKNGCGKSTLSKVLVGHPAYKVTAGTATYRGDDLFEMEPEERSHAGLFLSFQAPIEIPGVSNTDFLRMMYNARRKALGMPELEPLEFYGYLTPKLEQLNMDPSFLSRTVNEGFSGGEKKRTEILQRCSRASCPSWTRSTRASTSTRCATSPRL